MKSYKITYETQDYSHSPGFEFTSKREALKQFRYIAKYGSFWLNNEPKNKWNICLWDNKGNLIKSKIY